MSVHIVGNLYGVGRWLCILLYQCLHKTCDRDTTPTILEDQNSLMEVVWHSMEQHRAVFLEQIGEVQESARFALVLAHIPL